MFKRSQIKELLFKLEQRKIKSHNVLATCTVFVLLTDDVESAVRIYQSLLRNHKREITEAFLNFIESHFSKELRAFDPDETAVISR